MSHAAPSPDRHDADFGRRALCAARTRLLRPVALLGCFALGACSFGPPALTGQQRANQETVAACRERADQMWELRNRGAIYSPPPAINTPSSGAYAPGGMTERGLADVYTRDEMVRDCIRNTGTQTDRGREPSPTNAP